MTEEPTYKNLTREQVLNEFDPIDFAEKEAGLKESRVDHKARSHSVLGGSSALRWVNCPGSVFYTKDLPPEEPSEAALEGTKAHEFAEIALTDFLEHQITGDIDPDVRLELGCTDETMREHVKGYVKFIWDDILQGSLTGKAYGIETHFVLYESLGMEGSLDFWCVYIDDRGKRAGAVVDFKYGFHKIDLEKNAQLAFYACCLRKMFLDAGKDLDYIITALYQPRIHYK